MPPWTRPVVAAAAAALLAAAAVGAFVVGSGGAERAGGPGAPGAGTPPGATVEDVIPSIEAFVERERGLRFKHRVTVTLLEDEAFEARVTEVDDEDREDLKNAESELQAIGVLDRRVDLEAVVVGFSAGSVLGFYDPETDELVVRGATPTPFVRVVLAHELLHALEDQHFDLDRDDLGDEASFGFQALAEGSADRIGDRYRSSLSPAERAEVDREERRRGGSVPEVPEVVQVMFGFPYAFGPDFVAALLEAGGQARLDAAFADPPSSTEHVIDPRRYLAGERPRTVARPAADGEVFDSGEIGQLFLHLLLSSGLEAEVAREAAEGWGGDHFVAWREEDRTCLRVEFVMDTPADTAQLRRALSQWAAGRRGAATATGTSLLTCG